MQCVFLVIAMVLLAKGLFGDPNIISRSEWGARSAESISYMSTPVSKVFIHHGASSSCHNRYECSRKVRSYQNYHMDNKGWSDIGYSFIVGEDGNVYEGRGWHRQGAHTQGYNSISIGICFIGNFQNRAPNDDAIDAANDLMRYGADHGYLVRSYSLQGHRDVGSTECPGQALYDRIPK